MAITASVSRPDGGRADDIRAMKWRMRDVTLTGTYATGGFSVTAAALGLKRITYVVQAGMAPAADQATANEVSWELATNGTSVNFVLYENAAAGSPSAEKTNAEAPITGQVLHLVVVGY